MGGRLHRWAAGLELRGSLEGPASPARPSLPGLGSHTVEEEGDALGEGQGRHEPVDLEDVVPGRGSGEKEPESVSAGQGWAVAGGGGGGGQGHYVFLQSTDTQKMPAARKQADMIRYSLKRGISAADRKPSGFFSRIIT